PTALTFTYSIGSALPAAQTVSIRPSAGTPAYTVAITGANTQWLTVGPSSGVMPASLSVRVNPTSLAVGTYPATISITAAGVTNPLTIAVTLSVASGQPTLSVSTASLAFTSPPAQPAMQSFTLETTGEPIPFTVAAGSAWLSVTPTTGVVLPGAPVTVTVQADSSTLAASATAYVGKISITATGVPAANKSQVVNVTFLVNSLAPTISSIWPAGVLVNTPAATVTIRGTGYYASSVVMIGSQALPTTVVGSTALLATIPPVLLTTPQTLNFYVANPAPGGSSAPIAFIVTAVPTIQVVTNAASTIAGSIAPGEIVTMYGQGIGPLTSYPMQSTIIPGYVDTTVAGYSVTIDSVPSPILFLSQNMVTVQVPYEVTQGANKPIVITNGISLAAGTATIALDAPGLFSLDGSGAGQAAAMNYSATTQTYTLNGTKTAAAAGDTVIFYETGEGAYAASIATPTGYLVPTTLTPIPQMNPLPSVTIGGQQATVTYAGPSTGSLLGILQISAIVPAGSATGPAVPVSLSIGTDAAQSGITLAIK
ncbi:MAG TPA: IPT/TIG domain-containing protein, partial [Bryobacteraceae bacterium]